MDSIMFVVSSASTLQADFLFSISLLWGFFFVCIFVGFCCVYTFCVTCSCLSELRFSFRACMCLTCGMSLEGGASETNVGTVSVVCTIL